MKTAGPRPLALLLAALAALPAVRAPGAGTNTAAQTAAQTSGDYHLLPSDKVRFWIEEDPKAGLGPSDLPVTSLNMILFPVSRGYPATIPIDIRGKTLAEVKREVKARLEEEYYRHATPHLILLTQAQRLGLVYFNGEITGTLELHPGEQTTVTQAILQKGYGDYANLKKVTIKRIDPVTRKSLVIPVNVKGLLAKPDPAKDVLLQDRDIINVPSRSAFW